MSIYTDANNEFVISITEWCKNNQLDLESYKTNPDHRIVFGNCFMSEQDKEIQSQKMKLLMKEGRHNFQLRVNASKLEHNKLKIKNRMVGNNYGSFRKMTDELKNKISNGAKGNTNVRGTKWWNDGNNRKRSKESPGENWKEGFQINR
jgi:hypothetical protein